MFLVCSSDICCAHDEEIYSNDVTCCIYSYSFRNMLNFQCMGTLGNAIPWPKLNIYVAHA